MRSSFFAADDLSGVGSCATLLAARFRDKVSGHLWRGGGVTRPCPFRPGERGVLIPGGFAGYFR